MVWLVRRTVPTQARDPRAATLSPRQSSVGRRYAEWDAYQAAAAGLYHNIYVYACARARAVDLASLPIRVGADPDNPKDFDPNHPIAKLLGPAPGGPTMSLSARKLIAWTSMQFDIGGRFGWEIAPPENSRRDGVPFELWPLVNGKLTAVPSTGGAQWFSHYEYQVDTKRRLTTDQVMYYWRPKQTDFRDPESLMEAAKLNISVAVMQDKYDYSFLVNDARPAAVVVHEAFDVKTERDAFRRQFLDTHQGPENAGKVAFVEAAVDGALPKDSLLIQKLGLSQRDAEFIERYENQIRAICVAFATPLSRLADSSRRTYANAERETLNYWRNAVKPQAVEVAEAINVGLMPKIGDSSNVCWFDTTGVPELEPPVRFAVGDISELIDKKVITRNEGRASVYLEPVDGGDEWGVPGGVPDGDPATPDPAANPIDPTDPERSANILERLLPQVASQADALSSRLEASLDSRMAGKRGRQAEYAIDVLDAGFWRAEAFETFYSVAQTVAVAYDAHFRTSRSTAQVEDWCVNWATFLADQWTGMWEERLRSPIEDGTYAPNGPVPRIDQAVMRTLWASADATTITLPELERALIEVQSGTPLDRVLERL